MASKTPKIRMALKSDVIALYGEPLPYAIKGIVVDLDGEILGIAGVMYTYPKQACSTMVDKLRNYPITIGKTAKRFSVILEGIDGDVYAKADPNEKNSGPFLERIGFEKDDQGMYKWHSGYNKQQAR